MRRRETRVNGMGADIQPHVGGESKDGLNECPQRHLLCLVDVNNALRKVVAANANRNEQVSKREHP